MASKEVRSRAALSHEDLSDDSGPGFVQLQRMADQLAAYLGQQIVAGAGIDQRNVEPPIGGFVRDLRVEIGPSDDWKTEPSFQHPF